MSDICLRHLARRAGQAYLQCLRGEKTLQQRFATFSRKWLTNDVFEPKRTKPKKWLTWLGLGLVLFVSYSVSNTFLQKVVSYPRLRHAVCDILSICGIKSVTSSRRVVKQNALAVKSSRLQLQTDAQESSEDGPGSAPPQQDLCNAKRRQTPVPSHPGDILSLIHI